MESHLYSKWIVETILYCCEAHNIKYEAILEPGQGQSLEAFLNDFDTRLISTATWLYLVKCIIVTVLVLCRLIFCTYRTREQGFTIACIRLNSNAIISISFSLIILVEKSCI